jgi:phage-related tail protein
MELSNNMEKFKLIFNYIRNIFIIASKLTKIEAKLSRLEKKQTALEQDFAYLKGQFEGANIDTLLERIQGWERIQEKLEKPTEINLVPQESHRTLQDPD